MTIKQRVVLGFGALVAILIGVGGYSVHSFGTTIAGVRDVEEVVPDVLRITQIRDNLRRSFALLLSSTITSDATVLARYDAEVKSIAEAQSKLLDEQKSVSIAPEEKQAFDQLLACRTDYSDARTELMTLSRAGKHAEAAAVLNEKLLPTVDRYSSLVDVLIKMHTNELKVSLATIDTTSDRGRLTSIIGVSAGLFVSSVIGFLIVRSVNRALGQIATTLHTGSTQVASASSQVSASSQSLAQGASEQAASLEESSSAIEEMASMIKKNADTSQQANALSSEAKRAADAGSDAMSKMSGAIADIERSSQETAKIIKTIDEIAFQTNLLALNAAVEAARAGEAGKGFAVVAEEVRNLAMRSAEAAKNTNTLIEESVGKAKNGVSIASTVAMNLEEINQSTAKVTGLIAEIAAASKEQSIGIDQISQSVGQMDKVTQTTAANAEETAAASEELNAQAEQLQACVRDLQKLVGLNTARPGASGVTSQSSTATKSAQGSASPFVAKSNRDFSDFSAAA